MSMQNAEPVYFLLVDDLAENLLSLEALLRRENLVLLKARSGVEALELLLKHEVALALLDVQMPGMDGFELAELMRGTEKTRRVPIIFLTAGNADRQRRFRGYEAGAVDFLYKPIEADVLRSKADVFFELFRQRQQIDCQLQALKVSAEENDRLLTESQNYAAALKEADTRKDEFLATLAHELRNPLAPIRNGLQILKMSANGETTEVVRDMMTRQLSHLVHLIDDLLDVSRVSQGKISLRTQKLSVRQAVQDAIETSRPLIDASHHDLKVELPQEPLWIEADPTRMAQIIGNILNNAAKYTPDGGKITLAVAHEADNVVIRVTDNGVGIPADMLSKVFDLFTQVGRNLERAQGGLGIGLALVKRLTDMHNGTIMAASSGVGAGTTFTLSFPLVEAGIEEEPAATAASEAPANARALNVLVVDDNISSAQTTGWMLEMMGHHPDLAHDGIEALDAAKRLKPDVILLDIGLPGMNGYEVCNALRLDEAFKNTVIIAQTGWGQESDRRQAFAAGFNHHLVKPVNFEEFSRLFENLQTQNNDKA
ncbi:MAG: response regulator [Micavibrio sp.]|nr:response regulator [Micavibrio sp.]